MGFTSEIEVTDFGVVLVHGFGASNRSWGLVNNCTLFYQVDGLNRPPIRGRGTTTSKITANRNYAIASTATTVLHNNFSVQGVADNYMGNLAGTVSQTGVTNITLEPAIPVPWLWTGMTADNPLADYSGSLSGEEQYDMFGQLLTTAVGCIQHDATGTMGLPGGLDLTRGLGWLSLAAGGPRPRIRMHGV